TWRRSMTIWRKRRGYGLAGMLLVTALLLLALGQSAVRAAVPPTSPGGAWQSRVPPSALLGPASLERGIQLRRALFPVDWHPQPGGAAPGGTSPQPVAALPQSPVRPLPAPTPTDVQRRMAVE